MSINGRYVNYHNHQGLMLCRLLIVRSLLPLSFTEQIGRIAISLNDVVEITRFSKKLCYRCAAASILSVMPFTLVTLFLGLSHIYYPVYHVMR